MWKIEGNIGCEINQTVHLLDALPPNAV